MKKRFTFLIAALALLVFMMPSLAGWGQSNYSAIETSNCTLTAGTNGSTCTVNNKDGIKVGTSSKGGDMSVTVPAGAKYLHIHVAAWKGVSNLSLNITPNTILSPTSVALTSDSGIANSTPFTLDGDATSSDFYKVITFTNALTEETTITFTTSIAKRFVIWGVNFEPESSPTATSNVALATVANVDLTATYGNNTLTEGNNADINQGSTVTLTYSNVASGKIFDSWVITDEDATVVTSSVLEGNILTVPDYDIAISATLRDAQQYTVTFDAGSGTCTQSSTTNDEGTEITLPTASPSAVCAANGWTFEGWATAAVTETTTAPTLLTGSYTINATTTLYAVYTMEAEGAAPTAFSVGDIGTYAIVSEKQGDKYYALPTNPTVSSGKITAQEITVSEKDGVKYITTANASGFEWTIASATNGYTLSDGSKYIYHSNGGASGTNLEYGTSTSYTWSFTAADGCIKMAGMSGSTTNNRGMLFSGTTIGGYALSNWNSYYKTMILPIGDATTVYYNSNPVCTAPAATITVTETEIEVAAEGDNGTIEVTYEHFGTGMTSDVVFYTKDGETYTAVATADLETVYPWITASINNSNNVTYTVQENTATTSRPAYIRVYAIDDDDNEAYSDYITITQAAAPQHYTLTVTLGENVSAIYVFDTEDENNPLIADGLAGSVSVLEGTEIMVSPVIAEGYVIQSLMVGGTDVTSQMSGGSYTFTVTGNVPITATAVVNPFATATLTGAQMAAMENAGTTYGTGPYNLKYTTIDGLYWEANAWQQNASSQFLQINTAATNSAAGSYIKLPVFNGKIEEITLTVSNTSRTLYLNTTNSTSNTIATATDGSVTNTKVIDMSSVCYQTGYIVVSGGAVQISNITVKYRPYQDMTGTILEETIGNDVTVSIPANANVTAEGLAIPASSGIVINSGATLTVSGTLTNCGNANNLIIKDGGQLKFYGTGTKDGEVQATLEKNIEKYTANNNGWNFIASPINVDDLAPTAVTNMLTNTYDLYRLNNTKWENYKEHEGNAAAGFSLANGRGYLYANSTDVKLSFAGAIKPFNNENPSANRVSVNAGWNLIGNPYTFDVYVNQPYYSIIQAQDGITANTTVASKATAIKPCTGILVYAESIEYVEFSENEPDASTGNHGNIQMTLAHIVATRDGNRSETIDNAIVSFNEDAHLEKFYFGEPEANIYIPQNGRDYAIAFSNRQGDVPLNFKTNKISTYTISFEGEEMNLNGVYLIDMLEEEEIYLGTTPSYTFLGSPSDKAARFKIVFRNTFDNANDDIFAYQNGTDIIVSGEGELQIFDVMGRKVSSQRINGVETINVKSKGVYIMKLNEKTQKIVVR